MSFIRKADFFYGCMLSVLVNNGLSPAIIEAGDTRSIYTITTDNNNYEIFAKYASASSKRSNSRTWQFCFSKEEAEIIRNYQDNGKKFCFALICGEQDRLQDSEIALVFLEEIKKCLDVDNVRENYRVAVKLQKNRRGLKLYGTGLSEDAAIRLERDRISKL